MQGYWNRPDLDAKAFVTHNGAAGKPLRFYRTGDLVRSDEAGNLHFVGRADNQVKVRGYRVELDAIEARLMAHPDVAEAAVLALPAAEGTLNLHAWVIPAVVIGPEPKALTTFAGETLPWYAIPENIKLRRTFPRTGSGKIDRRALAKLTDLQ